MGLIINQEAPAFELKDVFGRQIRLKDYRDKKLLIAFFRHAACPFCNLRVHALQKEHEELKAQGLEMIFFFESKESVLLRSIFHKEVSPIPLISDPEKEWYEAYGLEESAKKSAMSHLNPHFIKSIAQAKAKKLPVGMMPDGESINTMPAEFLIDRGGIIKKVHYADRLHDRIAMEEVKAFAREKETVS